MSSILPDSESDSTTLYEQDPFDATRSGTLEFTSSAGTLITGTAVTWGMSEGLEAGVYMGTLDGTLRIMANGDYTYERPSEADINAADSVDLTGSGGTNNGNSILERNESVTDTFTIIAHETADSTNSVTATLDFTIKGLTNVLGINDTFSGTNEDDLIVGGSDSGDLITTTGGGRDVIIGGYGGDTITLGEGEKTIIHRFLSRDDRDNWRNDDGQDTINGFKRGTDKLALVDVDTDTPINGLTAFRDTAPTKQFSFIVNFDANDNDYITGFTLDFGDIFGGTPTVNYATSIEALVEGTTTTDEGAKLLGTNEAGINRNTETGVVTLTDLTLLENYFEEDNLDVIALAELDIEII